MAFTIPGSIIGDVTKAANDAKASAAASLPSFDSMLAAVKSGSIFKDISSSLSSIGNASAGLYAATPDNQLTYEGTDSIVWDRINNERVRRNLSTLTTLGFPRPPDDPLAPPGVSAIPSVDTSGIAAVAAAAKSTMAVDMAVAKAALTQKAKEAQARGETLSQADIDSAMGPLNVLKNLQGELAKATQAAAALTSNLASLNLSPSADPSAAVGAIGALGASLTASFSSMAAAGAASKANAITDLKANAMLAQLSKPQPADVAATLNANIDSSKINSLNLVKAIDRPAPEIPSQAPAADPNRPGTASILKDSGSLATSTGADNNKRIWTYELEQLKADEKKAKQAYYSSFGSSADATKPEQQAAFTAWSISLLDKVVGPGANAIREQSVAIKKAKPNVADRTPEEVAITEKSAANGKLVRASPEWIRTDPTLWNEFSQYQDWYAELYKNWTVGGDNRFALNAKLLEKISTYKL